MARKGNILSQKKKKNTAKAPKDFLRDQIKVGKKKAPAKNDTFTDYKVKQMQMPAQPALGEKGEEVTQRGLNLQELLAHVGHHSAKVREEAFRGLHELCSEHPGLLSTSLARILDAEAMIAIDSSADVREAFRKFQSWLIEELPPGSFAAFASTLAIQVRSALSHVSSEVREDGLLLLQLYVSRLSGLQVLNQAESSRIMQTLCQQKTQAEAVLRCLHGLLAREPEQKAGVDVTPQGILGASSALSTQQRAYKLPRLSLHGVLATRSLNSSAEGLVEANEEAASASHDSSVDSPIWEFCLRTWLQAGELPRVAAGRGASTSGPGWVQLRCAAVMERALEAAVSDDTDVTMTKSVIPLRPSASQLATLVGVVRRGEWPLQVDSALTQLRALADSVNLRMARVLALLASGGAPEGTPRTHLTRLACAALNFLDNFGASASSSGAGSNVSECASLNLRADVEILQGAARVAMALRSLDLLWAAAAQTCGEGAGGAMADSRAGPLLGPEHSVQLVTVTARFASGCGEGNDAATASAVLAAPLAASLLGLCVSSSTSTAPSSVRAAWPNALIACGEASFAEVVERSCPGAAVAWVSAWPKLLWYLGNSDPLLSAFLLSLMLELAKLASRAGGLHNKLLGSTCPLLLPFFVGRKGMEEEATTLATLPRGLAGAQGMAAAVLQHFPKISDALAAALTRLICKWSDLGLPGDDEDKSKNQQDRKQIVGIGTDCCELILESLLSRGSQAEPRSLPTRLRVAFTVLCARPPSGATSADRAVRAETAALRLADALAGWLMSLHSHEKSTFPAMPGLSYDDRRRLALQSLAWPLCKECLAVEPSLASRLLSFLFFCAARLPNTDNEVNDEACYSQVADLSWRTFLCIIFDTFLSADLSNGGGANMALCASPLCEPARGKVKDEAQSHAAPLLSDGLENDLKALQWASLRRLGQLFVVVWMKAVAAPQKPAAYELLTKLCTARLATVTNVEGSQQVAFQIISVLIAAIAWRNEATLSTSSWGFEGPDSAPGLKASAPEAIRSEITAQLQRLSIVAQRRDELKAMLLLL